MPYLNKAMIIGHVGRDPETRTTPSGAKCVRFSLATSKRYKGKDGEQRDETQWHSVTVWGKLADAAERLVRKGSSLYVEGEIIYRQWDGNDGQKKYATEINASTFQLLGGKSEAAPQQARPQQNNEVEEDLPW